MICSSRLQIGSRHIFPLFVHSASHFMPVSCQLRYRIYYEKSGKRCDAIMITGDLMLKIHDVWESKSERKKWPSKNIVGSSMGKYVTVSKCGRLDARGQKYVRQTTEKNSDQKICGAKIDFGKKKVVRASVSKWGRAWGEICATILGVCRLPPTRTWLQINSK